jgi:proliferating cell nuclear antigen PCNA
MDSEGSLSPYLVEVTTVQTSHIKSLFGSLKEHLAEANLDFSPDGIEILQMDATHITLVHTKLEPDNFDSYHCKKPVRIGIDVVNFTKLLKNYNNKDILTFFVEDPEQKAYLEEGSYEGIRQSFGLRIENPDKGEITTIYVDTIDVNEETLEQPDLDYPVTLEMPSSDLHSILNNAKNTNAEFIRIRFHKNELNFYSQGEVGRISTTRSKTSREETSINLINNEDPTDIIEIYVKLQKLFEFSKCSSLSNMVSIYLKKAYPIIVEYDVSNLGFHRLGLSPAKRPENW